MTHVGKKGRLQFIRFLRLVFGRLQLLHQQAALGNVLYVANRFVGVVSRIHHDKIDLVIIREKPLLAIPHLVMDVHTLTGADLLQRI